MKLTVTMTKPEKFFLAGYMLFQLMLPQLLLLLAPLMPETWSAAAVNFLFFLCNFLAVVTIARRFLLRSLRAALKTSGKLLRSAALWFAVYWVSTFAVSTLILLINPEFSNVNDSSVAYLVERSPALMTIGTVMLVPVVEECLYRGLLFGALQNRSRLAAYGVSAAVFCAVHVVGYIGTYPLPLLALCALQYLPASICLARAYEASDNIFTPILIHTTINAIGMIAMR